MDPLEKCTNLLALKIVTRMGQQNLTKIQRIIIQIEIFFNQPKDPSKDP